MIPIQNRHASTYAYLGPEGTFTEAALRVALPPSVGAFRRPYPTVPAALESVDSGECAAAVVPIENSIKGVVTVTLDQLACTRRLHIAAEVELPVTFALMARPGTRLADVTTVLSHPHALAQCADWLRSRLPDAVPLTADSTAAAARDAAKRDVPGEAAIAAPWAAERYGLCVLASDIGDRENAVTRFLLVGRAGLPPAPTGRDRTSLVVSVGNRSPGALVEILTVFSAGGLRLRSLHPWPTGAGLGNYRYFVDVEGHIDSPPLSRAVAALSALGVHVRLLGSYPRVAEVRGGNDQAPYIHRAGREILERYDRDHRSLL